MIHEKITILTVFYLFFWWFCNVVRFLDFLFVTRLVQYTARFLKGYWSRCNSQSSVVEKCRIIENAFGMVRKGRWLYCNVNSVELLLLICPWNDTQLVLIISHDYVFRSIWSFCSCLSCFCFFCVFYWLFVVVFFQWHFIDLSSCIAAGLFNKLSYLLTFQSLSNNSIFIGQVLFRKPSEHCQSTRSSLAFMLPVVT